MDAVELPLFTVSTLLSGREGGSGAGEVEAREPIASVPLFGGGSSVGRFSSSSTGKDITRAVTALEQNPFLRNKNANLEVCMHDGPLPSFRGESIGKQTTVKDSNSSLFLFPKGPGKQLQRKVGKPSKGSNPCFKRPRSEQVEGSVNPAITVDGNIAFGKNGSSLAECTEKSRVVGQKVILDGKRGDKRNFKPPSRSKYDSFCSKIGLASSSSAAGGGNIFGMYGLKSDIHDVTKHVDELSLSDLLGGSYKYPCTGQDKGKKATGVNENLLQTVKKACSILQPRGVEKPQNAAEGDNNSNKNMDTSLLSSGSSVTSGTDSSKRDNCDADLASSSKESCAPSNPTLLYEPKDILERLALPPVKDLDSILLDTSKPAVPSRSTTDLRMSKPMTNGARLPPFPWSQCFNGSSKTVIDSGKLSTSSKCRWVRIGSIGSYLGEAPSCHSDLDSITCDPNNFVKGLGALDPPHSLEFSLAMENLLRAPVAEGKQTHLDNHVVLTDPSRDHLRFLEKGNSFGLEQFKRITDGESASSSHYDGCDQHQWDHHMSENLTRGDHSPRLLAAAQTLYEISRHSWVQDQNNEKLRWLKKPSQKSMNARKSRSSMGKTDPFVRSKSPMGAGDLFRTTDQIKPTKKPKLSTSNKKKDCSGEGREPMKWSIHTSSRSPPTRSENAETKHLHAETVKHFGMLPPSKWVSDKACNGEQKPRKPVVVDWGRGWNKNEGQR